MCLNHVINCCLSVCFFVCAYLKTGFRDSDNTPSDEGVINEWWIGKYVKGNGPGLNYRHCPSICLEVLSETGKTQDIRYLGRDLNPGSPEYKVGLITTRPWRSMLLSTYHCHIFYEVPPNLIWNLVKQASNTEQAGLQLKYPITL
jgi:hypothetical protein